MNSEDSKALIEDELFSSVLQFDQLKHQMESKVIFDGFSEGPIGFRPTFKYDPGTDNWDSSHKKRAPAWCDRILWKGGGISQLNYDASPEYKLSDHKPVSSLFEVRH